ncbi:MULTISPECIES: class I SAM-dependent methyltransferase [Listeria]|uniref:class I SAM-dependent DNA methyltransferase n=1 Tax=Listeria TaxID=1637 RepID=UPI000B5893C8|nr:MULTISPECIES: methyltransferase domain-containing protein [Listeria]
MENNVFEGMAKKYDSPDRIELAQVISAQIRTKLPDAHDKNMLDYGSGTGLVGLALTDLVKDILLVDSSLNMVEIIQEKIAKRSISNAKAEVADLTKERLAEKVDIIIVSLVLLHIPDTKLILQRLYDSLNASGRLIIVDFDKNEAVFHPKVHNGFVASELSNLLQETGFSSTEINIFHHGENVFMKQDADLFIAVTEKSN